MKYKTLLGRLSPKNPRALLGYLPGALLVVAIIASPALAQEDALAEMKFYVGNLWLLVATAMVFIMHLGFSALEAGLAQRKNTINILFKNVCIISMGLLTYALVGFNLMYPGEEFAGGYFGFAGFWIGTDEAGVTSAYNPAYTYWTDFIFQGMFAATAATIVSGAVAERIKVSSFLVFSSLYVAFIYPVAGFWKWGGGFLNTLQPDFYDFAGSTLVHSVGGWAAFVGTLLLGPRIGKYTSDGKINPVHPHSMPLATIGVFLLWFGWYGFNGGSVLSADPGGLSKVFVTTSIAAAAGILGAIITARIVIRSLDLAMMLNGSLAGLVGITAGADVMGTFDAAIIGVIAGGIVVVSVVFLDRIKVDDPVGAISVHLVCGIFGTLMVGVLGERAGVDQFLHQLLGVLAVGGLSLGGAFVIFSITKVATGGLRVSEEVERVGLDRHEHGVSAYRGYLEILENEKELEGK